MYAEASPSDYFCALVDDNIFQNIAEQTNLYATQQILKRIDTSASPRLHKWLPIDVYEIKRLFGLLLYIGIVKMPNIRAYWSNEKMFKNAMASECMSRNRLELLLRMLHFVNN